MRVEPDGKIPNDLAIFGEAPGFEEQQEGHGFVGKSGRELWSAMRRHVGLTREDFYVSNLIKDGLPKNRDPKPDEVAEAMPEFIDEILAVRPRLVITAGAFSTRAVLGPVTMNNVHGIPHEAEIAGHRFVCLPIYHPAAGLHNKGMLAPFAYDLGRVAAFRSGQIRQWAPTKQRALLEWLLRDPGKKFKASVVALDTEGWPEKPWGLGYTHDGTRAWVIPAHAREALAWFANWIRGKTLVLHNGIHDIPVLRAMGIEIGDFHDTQVLAYHDMLRTGSGALEAESQNLGTLAYRELGLVLQELSDLRGVDFDSREIPYSDEVMEYSAMDPIATWRLFRVYESRGLLEHLPYQIDMGQVGLVEQMIANGLPFDQDAALDYCAEVLDKLETVTADLKSRAARLGNRDFNPGSHPQVRELVTRRIGLKIRKRTKGGLASTNEKALADHKSHPFVQKLQEHRELVKLKGTYIVPLLEELQ